MLTIQGTIKRGGAYEVNAKNGKQIMISFTVADEIGNMFSCQMWQDDPQHQDLAQVIGNANLKPVQCTVSGFSVRKRTNKEQKEVLQANFIVTRVAIAGMIAPAAPVSVGQ